MAEKKPLVLIVEDNLLVSSAVKEILSDEGYEAVVVDDGKSANAQTAKRQFNVVLLDMMLPDVKGVELLTKWQKEYPDMPVIIMTAHADVSTAVQCLKAGAYDFLEKPVEKPHLLKSVANAIKSAKLQRRVEVLTELSKREIEVAELACDIVAAKDSELSRTLDLARTVSQSDFSCLFIKGESGTGKGLFARTIHKWGNRSEKPFVEVNCSALPATLIESELFGHVKGAFTDAKDNRVGLFEMADGGTLFLDEIGDMDFGLQAKLLKVIEEQKFRRVGGTADITVNVAIIAATNQDVEKLTAAGKFRVDLFYRLNVIPLELPPLRRRPTDIPVLANHFLAFFSRKFGKSITGFSDSAMKALMALSWPGNVRELRNVVERGCILTKESLIDSPQLLFADIQALPPSGSSGSEASLAEPERQSEPESLPAMPLAKAEELVIMAAMRKASGNKNEAARILGVHRTTLYKKLEEYHIPDTAPAQ